MQSSIKSEIRGLDGEAGRQARQTGWENKQIEIVREWEQHVSRKHDFVQEKQ